MTVYGRALQDARYWQKKAAWLATYNGLRQEECDHAKSLFRYHLTLARDMRKIKERLSQRADYVRESQRRAA